jgi:hypothetical protein
MHSTFNVAGVTHGALHDGTILPERYGHIVHVYLEADPDNEHDADAIAVYAVIEQQGGADGADAGIAWAYRIGYVPAGRLAAAHRNGWCDRVWTVQEMGTWSPRAPNLPQRDRVVPYCRLMSVTVPAPQ